MSKFGSGGRGAPPHTSSNASRQKERTSGTDPQFHTRGCAAAATARVPKPATKEVSSGSRNKKALTTKSEAKAASLRQALAEAFKSPKAGAANFSDETPEPAVKLSAEGKGAAKRQQRSADEGFHYGRGGMLSHGSEELDTYGKGSPTDRLQFGYSPSNSAEAIGFHASIPSKRWLADRKKNGKIVFVKKQQLFVPNCEPLTSVLKLKQHWKEMSEFVSSVRLGGADLHEADNFLAALAAQQRMASGVAPVGDGSGGRPGSS